MKRRGKLILRKESFGGLFFDTINGKRRILRPDEYEAKRHDLLEARRNGTRVKFFDATERGYELIPGSTSSPASAFFELTKKCNGRCVTCYMDSNSPKFASMEEVTFPEVEDIITQMSDLGAYKFRMTGGEATLRHDFFDIVDLMNEEGFITGVNTNGLYGEEMITKILDKGIQDIRISLDGPEKVNDSIRGEGTYRQVRDTLKNIAEYNKTADRKAYPTINVVLMKSNMDYIEEMIELAHGFGFKISFGLLRISGRADKNQMLSPEEMVQVSYRVQKMRERLDLPKGRVRVNYDIFCETGDSDRYAPHPFDNSKCPIGSSGLNIDAFGRIAPCGYMVDFEEWSGEDLRGRDILEVWHNSEMLKRARDIKRPGCGGCEYHAVKCNGGCPATAYAVSGDINGRDPYCVRDVDVAKAIAKVARREMR